MTNQLFTLFLTLTFYSLNLLASNHGGRCWDKERIIQKISAYSFASKEAIKNASMATVTVDTNSLYKSGTGFFVNPKQFSFLNNLNLDTTLKYVITNRHVAATVFYKKDAKFTIRGYNKDGKVINYEAIPHFMSRENDLALLVIANETDEVHTLDISEKKPQIGSQIAFFPQCTLFDKIFKSSPHKLTGTIVAKNTVIANGPNFLVKGTGPNEIGFLPGTSGSAIIDFYGKVIGVVSGGSSIMSSKDAKIGAAQSVHSFIDELKVAQQKYNQTKDINDITSFDRAFLMQPLIHNWDIKKKCEFYLEKYKSKVLTTKDVSGIFSMTNSCLIILGNHFRKYPNNNMDLPIPKEDVLLIQSTFDLLKNDNPNIMKDPLFLYELINILLMGGSEESLFAAYNYSRYIHENFIGLKSVSDVYFSLQNKFE